jgi:hypothetical protein
LAVARTWEISAGDGAAMVVGGWGKRMARGVGSTCNVMNWL